MPKGVYERKAKKPKRVVEQRERRSVEVAHMKELDAVITQAIEDTIEHCSICGLPITDDVGHAYCTAEMNSNWRPPNF